MAKLLGKVKASKKPTDLGGVFGGNKTETPVEKTIKKAAPIKKEKENIVIQKSKKVNASYSIDKKNNVGLRRHVLQLQLDGVENDELEEISASAIVNNLITEYLNTIS